jgi:hypothetical protein
MTRIHHQLCAEMHSNDFSGPSCFTGTVRRPGASERSENDGECVPAQTPSFFDGGFRGGQGAPVLHPEDWFTGLPEDHDQ